MLKRLFAKLVPQTAADVGDVPVSVNGATEATSSVPPTPTLEDVFRLEQYGARDGGQVRDIPFGTSPMIGLQTFALTTNPYRLLVIGCENGLWFGGRDNPEGICFALPFTRLKQFVVLGPHETLLVLWDRTLHMYSANDLVPNQVAQPLAKFGTNVDLVMAGQLEGQRYVVYTTRQGSESKIHVLEPLREFPQPKTAMFRIRSEFNVSARALDVFFLQDRLAVATSTDYELIHVTSLRSERIPHPKKPARRDSIVEFEELPRPLGIFELTPQELLLCYDDYGCVWSRRDPQNPFTMVWKTKATGVAFHPPYLLLFSSSTIEVRHIFGLRLVQILQAHDIRCVSDGRPNAERGSSRKQSLLEWENAIPDLGCKVYAVQDVLVRADLPIQRVMQVLPRV